MNPPVFPADDYLAYRYYIRQRQILQHVAAIALIVVIALSWWLIFLAFDGYVFPKAFTAGYLGVLILNMPAFWARINSPGFAVSLLIGEGLWAAELLFGSVYAIDSLYLAALGLWIGMLVNRVEDQLKSSAQEYAQGLLFTDC